MSVSDPGEKIEWGADSEPRKNERVPSSANYKCQQERKTFFIPGLADRVRRGVSGVRLGVIGRGRDLQHRLLLRSSLMLTISSRNLRYGDYSAMKD
jgi:hypothetical protein